MEVVKPILGNWLGDAPAVVQPLDQAGGFSGARLWRVEHAGRQFALRQWPPGSEAPRLQLVHALQGLLASHELPVPAPVRTRHGPSLVEVDGRHWELAPWMPGVANYWSDPRPAKLAAAFRTLARVHEVLEDCRLRGEGFAIPGSGEAEAPLAARIERLFRLDLAALASSVQRLPAGCGQYLAAEAIALADRALAAERRKAARWRQAVLPAQWRLRDVWHDHILFTGAQVTGVIDFGAADVGTPAVDIARLLGSLVGDDAVRWHEGLDAYESVRPLSPAEREATRFIDSSGVLLSAVNWLGWLYLDHPSRHSFNRDKAEARLRQLVARLRVLAERA